MTPLPPLRSLLACTVAAALQLPTAPVRAQELPGEALPVHEVRLDNGMRVLVLRRAGAPTVSFVVQYGVGSVNEHLGDTGIAHLLEHMLFKGTTTVGTRDVAAERGLFEVMDAMADTLLTARGVPFPDSAELTRLREGIRALEDSARTFVIPNELDRILSRNGARNLNATTTEDATTYYVQLPSNRLELWFVLEADRMANPVFREFYTERDVVMEERRTRIDTSPGGRLYEEHLAHAWTMHPYGVPVAGYMSDLAQLTRPEVRSYYRRFYGPANAVVAIVGDVDPDRVEALARTYFGPLPPGDTPPPVLAAEPPQQGERRVVVRFDAEPRLRIGWHVVDAFHPDHPALTILTALLTGGRTSRLYRRLVLDERLATAVTSSTGPGDRFPQLFQIDVIPRAPHTTEEVEAAVYAELDSLRAAPPGLDELERVRNQVEAGDVRRLTSNLGLAFQLAGSTSLYGDWRETFRASRRLAAVTPSDVQRVARRYFTRDNRTVAILERRNGVEGGGS